MSVSSQTPRTVPLRGTVTPAPVNSMTIWARPNVLRVGSEGSITIDACSNTSTLITLFGHWRLTPSRVDVHSARMPLGRLETSTGTVPNENGITSQCTFDFAIAPVTISAAAASVAVIAKNHLIVALPSRVVGTLTDSTADPKLPQRLVEAQLRVRRLAALPDDERAADLVRAGGEVFRPRPRDDDGAGRDV